MLIYNRFFIFLIFIYKYQKIYYICINGDWGLGIGDWGLGVGPIPKTPNPNPKTQTPIV
jgi:hypothetical protein